MLSRLGSAQGYRSANGLFTRFELVKLHAPGDATVRIAFNEEFLLYRASWHAFGSRSSPETGPYRGLSLRAHARAA